MIRRTGFLVGRMQDDEFHTVRVSNVSPKATEHDIQDFFSFSGEIQYIKLIKYAFLCAVTPAVASVCFSLSSPFSPRVDCLDS